MDLPWGKGPDRCLAPLNLGCVWMFVGVMDVLCSCLQPILTKFGYLYDLYDLICFVPLIWLLRHDLFFQHAIFWMMRWHIWNWTWMIPKKEGFHYHNWSLTTDVIPRNGSLPGGVPHIESWHLQKHMSHIDAAGPAKMCEWRPSWNVDISWTWRKTSKQFNYKVSLKKCHHKKTITFQAPEQKRCQTHQGYLVENTYSQVAANGRETCECWYTVP